jgi:PAS domain S-box-containing protein
MQRDPGAARWMAVTFSGEGHITSVSPEAEEVTGYTSRELAERSITEILGDPSVFRLPDMLNTCRECGTWSGEVHHLHRSGLAVQAYGVLSLLSTAGGDLPSFLLISAFSGSGSEPMKDAHLREIGARLREFAHQLNNPLAVVLGFTQLIMTSPQCTGTMQGDMEKLYSEMRRLVEVVQRLHKYAFSLQESARHEDVLRAG